MNARSGRQTVVPSSLGGLRLRLTAWYVGTFVAILGLLGLGLFVTVTRQFDKELDDALRETTKSLADVVQRGGSGAAQAIRFVADRPVMVLDANGRTLNGPIADDWLKELASTAREKATSVGGHHANGEQLLRAEALPFTDSNGQTLIAIAVGDEVEIEDRYASLIATTAVAAVAAIVLVAVGGWIVVRQSTDPVERAVAHMRRFMADAAHELRTPLSVVRSRAEIALQRPRAPEEYVETLSGIESESMRVARIVEDLLTLARADAGERPIERKRVFLDDVTLDAVEAARALAERRGVCIDVEQFEEARVQGDAALLRQLVLIFLDNAIKFSHEHGRVAVAVSATTGVATLTVSDNGLGIPQAQLPHVFERFYRGDGARTRTASGGSEGAGLGLSIAQWIANEHGAVVSIDSEEGYGTRVTVQFPHAGMGAGAVELSSS